MTLTITVLGCNTPYPEPGSPCSGYLVDASGTLILLELGLAVWPELLRHTDPDKLAAIWISHLHADHSGDLLAAYQWAANTKGVPRIPIYGPPGWAARIGAALPAPDGSDQLRRLFDVREHTTREQKVNDVTIRSIAVQHGVPAYGIRLTHLDHTLAYSGDTKLCPELETIAAEAHIFLCEVGATAVGSKNHCTPEDAAHAGASAKRLVLTHLARDLTTTDATWRASGAQVAQAGAVLHCP
ncbi:MBL fold metallo-hydrolase [Kribbella alba]|uniref:MBL fold metallo-hydrolase n=1 Tax=Kribbella alba TaxID=190197 RepID=A0ABN2FEA3_9ACTN